MVLSHACGYFHVLLTEKTEAPTARQEEEEEGRDTHTRTLGACVGVGTVEPEDLRRDETFRLLEVVGKCSNRQTAGTKQTSM